jgi:hypothetical protein
VRGSALGDRVKDMVLHENARGFLELGDA